MNAGLGNFSDRGRGYSRFVSIAKVLLSSIAVSVLLLVVLWTQFNQDDPLKLIGISSMKSDRDEDAGLLNPRFVGTDPEGRSFTITADLVMNPDDAGKPIQLLMPKADLELSNGAWVIIMGRTADYSHSEKRLDLKENVSLFHDSGLEVHTEEASIDLARRIAFSRHATRATGAFGAMTAEGFEIRDDGRRLFLLGRCQVNLHASVLRRKSP